MKNLKALISLICILAYFIPVFAQDKIILEGEPGLKLVIEQFEITETAGRFTPSNGIYLTMFAIIVNETDSEQCVYARDIRLIYETQEYPPERAIMNAIQRNLEPRRDYVGPVNGQCVRSKESALTFAAFDVPKNMQNFIISFHRTQQNFVDFKPVDSQTVLPTLTIEPTEISASTETPVPIFDDVDKVDAAAISDGLFILAGGRDVQTVIVVNGRPNGGERSVLISYLTRESTEVGIVDEIIDILSATAATIRASKIDVDSVQLILGDAFGKASGLIAVSTDDLLQYHQGKITKSEFLQRLTITDL